MCHNISSCVYHSLLHYCLISFTLPSFLIFCYSKLGWLLHYYWKEREGLVPPLLGQPASHLLLNPTPLHCTQPCLRLPLALWLVTTRTLWALRSWPLRRTPLHLLPTSRRVVVGQTTLLILPLLLIPCKPTAQDLVYRSNSPQGLGLLKELST